MEILVLFFVFIFISPFILITFYIINRVIKGMNAKQIFAEQGEMVIQATVSEVFRGSDFYIVYASFVTDDGKKCEYRSKRLQNKPQIEIGDRINVTVARKDPTVYRLIKL